MEKTSTSHAISPKALQLNKYVSACRILAGLIVLIAIVTCVTPLLAATHNDIYKAALLDFRRLLNNERAASNRTNWINLDKRFHDLYLMDTKGPTAPKALFYEGWVYQELADRTDNKNDYLQALTHYQQMADQFPRHSWTDDALFRKAEIYSRKLHEDDVAKLDLQRIIKSYKHGDRYTRAKEMLAELNSPRKDDIIIASSERLFSQNAALDDALPPLSEKSQATQDKPAYLTSITSVSGSDYTRVILNVDLQTKYRYQLLPPAKDVKKPRRLYIDLDNTHLGKGIQHNTIVSDGILKRIRAGQNTPDVTRIVLDIDSIDKKSVFTLDNPFRIILDVYGDEKPAQKGTSGSRVVAKVDTKSQSTASRTTSKPSRTQQKPTTESSQKYKASNQTASRSSSSSSVRNPVRKPAHQEPKQARQYKLPPGSKQQAGELLEQLGLTVDTIMIDAGHGGKDPGAQGLYGINEKDINLKFAKELGALLRKRGFKVLYTRTTDVFIPLEKRTALANKNKADLFVSIHCNAHSDQRSSGIETYSLNLASSKRAVGVAARENSVDPRKISDLQFILTDLMLNSKMRESRDLASSVQNQTVKNIRNKYSIHDRGIQEAPFYVLMGAKMPSILVELGYITNPEDAKHLKSSAYMRRLTEGLADGIGAYKKRIERYAKL